MSLLVTVQAHRGHQGARRNAGALLRRSENGGQTRPPCAGRPAAPRVHRAETGRRRVGQERPLALLPAPAGSRGTRTASPHRREPSEHRMPDPSRRRPRVPGPPPGIPAQLGAAQPHHVGKCIYGCHGAPPERRLRRPTAREASAPGNKPLPAQLSPPPAGSFHFLTAKSPRGAPLPPPPPPLRPPEGSAPRRAAPGPARPRGPRPHPGTFGL